MATSVAAEPVVYDIVPLRASATLAMACPVGGVAMRCDTAGAIEGVDIEAALGDRIWEFEGVEQATADAWIERVLAADAREAAAAERMAQVEAWLRSGEVETAAIVQTSPEMFAVWEFEGVEAQTKDAWIQAGLAVETGEMMDIQTASIPRAATAMDILNQSHAEMSASRKAEAFLAAIAKANAERVSAKADAFLNKVAAAHADQRAARVAAAEAADRFLVAMAEVNAGIETASIPSADARAEAFLAAIAKANDERVAMAKADAFLNKVAVANANQRAARVAAAEAADRFLVAMAEVNAGIETASIPSADARAEAFLAAIAKANDERVAMAKADAFLNKVAVANANQRAARVASAKAAERFLVAVAQANVDRQVAATLLARGGSVSSFAIETASIPTIGGRVEAFLAALEAATAERLATEKVEAFEAAMAQAEPDLASAMAIETATIPAAKAEAEMKADAFLEAVSRAQDALRNLRIVE